MSSGNGDTLENLKWILGTTLPIGFTLIIMWWKGIFSKVKEEGRQQVEQIRRESSFEQADELTGIVIKNVIDKVKSIEVNHQKISENVGILGNDVVAIKKDIYYMGAKIEEIKKLLEGKSR